VKNGEKIGLVGESGSGKSTVLQLLMRIYEPTSGDIFVDGKNIKDFDLYHFRRQFGIVNQ
jgi:ABC-type multidrug transport system fused ATPase/permease subunit